MESMISNNNNRILKIDSSVLYQIFRYRQTRLLSPEAGGVLIGRELESTNNLIIERITEPHRLDRQFRFRFERKDPAHIYCFNELYDESDKTYGYFGEWHTHPEKIPHYSTTDEKHWRRIYHELPQKHSLYFLIAGIDAVGLWELDLEVSEHPIKVSLDSWKCLMPREI